GDDPLEKLVQAGDFLATQELYRNEGYEANGILPPEAVVLHALIRHYKPEVVLESGTYRGQSAVVICQAMRQHVAGPQFHTASPNEDRGHDVARRRLASFPFANIHEGWSQEVFPSIIGNYHNSRLAFFIDGPKGDSEAFTQVLDAVGDASQLDFVAVHDCE